MQAGMNRRGLEEGSSRARAIRTMVLGVAMLVSFAALAATCHADGIVKYRKGRKLAYTNDGTGSVLEFAGKIKGARSALRKADRLYVGYHGRCDGTFLNTFDGDQVKLVKAMKTIFGFSTRLKWISSEMSVPNIRKAINKHTPVFTWCDSDKRVGPILIDMGYTKAKTYSVRKLSFREEWEIIGQTARETGEMD